MKKLVAILLSTIMIFSVANPSVAVGEDSNDYELLVEQGFPTEYLDNLDDAYLHKMVELIGENCVGDIQIKKTMFGESSNLSRGLIDPESLTLQIATSTLSPTGSSQINGVLVAVDWMWKEGRPLYKGKDAVTVNWDSTIFSYCPDSFYARDVYRSNADDEWTIDNEYSVLAISNQGGLGHWTDPRMLKRYVGGTLLFILDPTSPMIKGNKLNTTINVQYTHAPIGLTGLSFSTTTFGVGVNWTLTCDTMADSSKIYFSR